MKAATAVVLAAGALFVSVIALVAVAFAQYPGSGFIFVFFNLCFFGSAVLMFPKPRLYGYTFLAALLILGFWLKVLVHTIWAPGFIEPVGDFGNTAEEWDSALLAASHAVLGVIIARCGHFWFRRKTLGSAECVGRAMAPDWFIRWRQPVWILTIVLVIVVNAANLHFAFFQIGVNPRLILPMSLNVLLGWLVNIGFALWVAALLWWDLANDSRTLARNLIMPMVESFFSSVSAFSRLIFPLHAGPYWIAILEHRKELAAMLKPRPLAALAGCFLVLFVLSMLTVFWLRVLNFYYLPPNVSSARNFQRVVAHEVPSLFVHRWVGLEGILTAGATAGRGRKFLMAAITDDPKLGGQSLYQRVSKVHYLAGDPRKFTFLTNAGVVAILLFSGSLTVVLVGMMLIVSVLILTEEITRRWTGNPFLLAVSGAALANVVGQTTFFYLTVIFVLQMWVAIGFLGAIQRWRIGKLAARRSP